jgi:hypothetical protein
MAFKNGKFYDFSPRHVLVMSAWPDPRAWLKRASHGWKATRKWPDELLSHALFPKGAIYEPSVCGPNNEPFAAWVEELSRRQYALQGAYFDTIPDLIRADLLRYGKRKWHLLNLMARCPRADDLSRSNPALAYALASNWVFHKPGVTHPMRSARCLVNRKQKRILEWLGFPATESTRRILAKIVPRSLSVMSLLYLRNALADPWVRGTLSHLDRINASALRLVTNPRLREHVTPRLIEDVSRDAGEDRPYGPVWYLLDDTLRMADRADWHGCPRQFASLRRLQSLHDELTPRLETMWQNYPLPERFPPPPFSGTTEIQPVRTPLDLVEEGKVMQHCVAIRAEQVAKGWQYVYRVLQPTRATLAIVKTGQGWMCMEMRGARNAKIPLEIQKRVSGQLLATEPGAALESDPEPTEWNGPEEDAPGLGFDELNPPEPRPTFWDRRENEERVAALSTEDQRLYQKCLAVFGKPKSKPIPAMCPE